MRRHIEDAGRAPAKLLSFSFVVCLAAAWPQMAAADAVTAWNVRAGRAAMAACLSPTGNGLAEARMYAMVHVAMHDALNAIDRRSRPYAYDAHVNAPTSRRGAIAAAARDVLVSVIGQLQESQACIDAGIASAEADYAAVLATIPNGPAKRRGIRLDALRRRRSSTFAAGTVRRSRWSTWPIRRGPNRASGASRPACRSRLRHCGAT
jgi:hypothetical protein